MSVRTRSAVVLVRTLLTLCMVVLTAPLWIAARCEHWLGGEGVFQFCSELLSLVPGKPGVFVRRGFYLMSIEHLAGDGHIGFGTTLSHRSVSIGHRVYIGHRCTVGSCILGDDVTIGSNVDILSGRRQHNFSAVGIPIQGQGGAFEQVRIGRNCWIGNSAVIMADIGEETIVGAGSVVAKALPALVVAVGNPARVVRERVAAEEQPLAKELECTGS